MYNRTNKSCNEKGNVRNVIQSNRILEQKSKWHNREHNSCFPQIPVLEQCSQGIDESNIEEKWKKVLLNEFT